MSLGPILPRFIRGLSNVCWYELLMWSVGRLVARIKYITLTPVKWKQRIRPFCKSVVGQLFILLFTINHTSEAITNSFFRASRKPLEEAKTQNEKVLFQQHILQVLLQKKKEKKEDVASTPTRKTVFIRILLSSHQSSQNRWKSSYLEFYNILF